MSVITLLSDFGSTSPYPAEMRGVLRSLCRAALVDLTHDVPAHDIVWGAHLLAAAAPAFPAGTIHLAVVDPGVGTRRLPLAIASSSQILVGPDNGLLMVAARAMGTPRAYAIDVERFARRPLSSTFHGRDLFAPVAAAMARGLPVAHVGPPVPAPVVLPEHPPAREAGRLHGQVVYCDPFGNLITNIPAAWLDGIAGLLVIEHARGRTAARLVAAYGDGAPGEVLILKGSHGTAEIAVHACRATDIVPARVGEQIIVTHH